VSAEEITRRRGTNPRGADDRLRLPVATYKRGNLLFKDLSGSGSCAATASAGVVPVRRGRIRATTRQEGHPRDHPFGAAELLSYRVVFLEDCEIIVARYMVQGCDVVNMLRPLAPAAPADEGGVNGAPPVGARRLAGSGFHRDYGWAIGSGEEYDDHDYQDRVAARRSTTCWRATWCRCSSATLAGIPREWVDDEGSMKPHSALSSHRMLRNYIDEAYLPADRAFHRLAVDKFQRPGLAGWRRASRSAGRKSASSARGQQAGPVARATS
jgi:starch phosphorylase